jgi:hypothetical protein
MPTWFCRGPPFKACARGRSAYSESRHSVPYADIGIRRDIAVVGELFVADGTYPPARQPLGSIHCALR